ncbi:serine/threonine-protein kinase HipA [Chitinophaga skermanii]|uniref:Serine/threonine-protein kinase HipA n=1 Tax=Chitinophaga skermanii TaxID=331697 RepID=A0A327QXV6_9BACT|nr:HipA domain-containing protein [Chitinophaga skermanii]RAJ08472.1 serine/threonine-protein kinase HipA [Chitinophaga skermanii]
MHQHKINVCPSTLRANFNTYSPLAQANLFGERTRRVSHILPMLSPSNNVKMFNEKRQHISISGVQEKYFLRQVKNNLSLTENNSTHILKPIPLERLERLNDLPANEHVTMQIAKQVYQLKTAECGLIFFEDGSPAYITKRFDYKPNSVDKYALEDFASLLSKSPIHEGDSFKYNASYLQMAEIIQQYVAAAPVALVEFYQLIVFNYLFGNGDAHLKNFSLMETQQGDFMLSPAYDLLCTKLHIDDSALALYGGDYDEASYYQHGTYTGMSFVVFAEKIGISPKLASRIIEKFLEKLPKAIAFINHSFLSEEAKTHYIYILQTRKKLLSILA